MGSSNRELVLQLEKLYVLAKLVSERCALDPASENVQRTAVELLEDRGVAVGVVAFQMIVVIHMVGDVVHMGIVIQTAVVVHAGDAILAAVRVVAVQMVHTQLILKMKISSMEINI
ncbi:hypothetical protein TTRE_0000124601 [Trichuris trichiura]|uniref:Uncharacterized protein n=1 Tax=Trichuris trichiura TaxID=36087 RepID=A0A077YZU4_TRITR|nr:hypothetical protein TTRE_0000124601 [Trichuris trichiura]